MGRAIIPTQKIFPPFLKIRRSKKKANGSTVQMGITARGYVIKTVPASRIKTVIRNSSVINRTREKSVLIRPGAMPAAKSSIAIP